MSKYTIGVDLGGTNIAAGIVDENYNIVDKLSCKTNLPRPSQEVEKSIAELCCQLCAKNNIDIKTQIEYVGIGTPGNVNAKAGIVDFSANFDYHNWHLAENMEKLLDCKAYIENDANAAAYGEYLAGGAKGSPFAIIITLGTGIGSGIIIDGKIFTGYVSAGGEFGHTVIEIDGRPCMCGRKGCWEKYASSRALAEDTRTAMELHKDNMMWQLVDGDISKVNARTAFDAMRAGDALGAQLVDTFAKYIACGITDVINIFQPDVICIGGGVSKEGETLLAPVRRYVDKEDFARDNEKRTRIVTAKLFNDAGIVGAAFLGK